MIPTRQRFRALMVALAHFWPPVELGHWVETVPVPDSKAVSWPALLWGLCAEPAELSGWAAAVGAWGRSGEVAALGALGIGLHQARYRWEIVTTGENPWLAGAIAAWMTGEIPQEGLDFLTLQQAIAWGDRLYQRWAGLRGQGAAVFHPHPVAEP